MEICLEKKCFTCRHSSDDSSALSILPSKVRFPCTSSMLLSIYIYLCHVEKDKNKHKVVFQSHQTDQKITTNCRRFERSNWKSVWRINVLLAAIAQRIHLRFPSCRPRFDSYAHHLCFYQFILICVTWKKTNINIKRMGLAHLKKCFAF